MLDAFTSFTCLPTVCHFECMNFTYLVGFFFFLSFACCHGNCMSKKLCFFFDFRYAFAVSYIRFAHPHTHAQIYTNVHQCWWCSPYNLHLPNEITKFRTLWTLGIDLIRKFSFSRSCVEKQKSERKKQNWKTLCQLMFNSCDRCTRKEEEEKQEKLYGKFMPSVNLLWIYIFNAILLIKKRLWKNDGVAATLIHLLCNWLFRALSVLDI